MKRFLFLTGFVSLFTAGFAQQVSYQEAQTVAQNFLSKQQKSAIACSYIAKNEKDTLLYVFNSTDAFVIIAADKRVLPVLAFSDKAAFDANNLIAPVKMWLDNYENQLRILKTDNYPASPSTIKAWDALLKNQKDFDNDVEAIAPLLTSKWGQGMEYNYYCPIDAAGTNGRAVTGCVATAMAQIMYYFRFPSSGTGAYSYQHDLYGTLSADFANATYNYPAMTDAPLTINLAAALLIHHCGVAVDMVYGAKSSGMYNHKAAYAMHTYFKYSPATSYVFRDTCSLSWDSLIVSHLNKKIPLYYAGWSVPDTNGHAFVCDGYKRVDSNYYYHFNFGWDSYMDGYFYTNALSPGGNNFNLAQEIIINAYPDTSLYDYPQPLITGTTTLTAASGSFEDGSGRIDNYANAMDYTWIVQPDADSIQKIDFYIHYQIAENDTLFITSNGVSPQNYVITNDSAVLNVSLQASRIVVRMVSGSGITKGGFYASYVSSLPIYCSPLQLLSAKTGKIEDGSGNKKYTNFTECKKRLKINDVTCITLHFTAFETEKDKDFLYIYDYASENNDLLLTLSGSMGDTSFTFTTNTLFFVFTSDEQNTYEGWEVSYTSGMIGVDEYDNYSNTLRIYPNPASNELMIEHTKNEIKTVKIYTVLGEEVKECKVFSSHGSIPVSELCPGIYVLKIETATHTFAKKFIKQ
ncbi:MAG: C10 family peptidase [Bacteroidales bacterium]|jgi:hypothetical protein|nr:C10 family peptidase [Bacteroidales bacterium]